MQRESIFCADYIVADFHILHDKDEYIRTGVYLHSIKQKINFIASIIFFESR